MGGARGRGERQGGGEEGWRGGGEKGRTGSVEGIRRDDVRMFPKPHEVEKERSKQYHLPQGRGGKGPPQRQSPPTAKNSDEADLDSEQEDKSEDDAPALPVEEDVIPDESALEESESVSVAHDTDSEAHVTRSLPKLAGVPHRKKNGFSENTWVSKDNRQCLRDQKEPLLPKSVTAIPARTPREKNTKCAACGRIGPWRGDAACEKEQEYGKSQVGHVGEDHVIEFFPFHWKWAMSMKASLSDSVATPE